MTKKILVAIALVICTCSACSNKSENTDKVSTVNIIKSDASYGDDMVTLVQQNMENGKCVIKYYNPATKGMVYACGLANCSHNTTVDGEIKCNAIFEEEVLYPFIFEDKLYYFVGTGSATLYQSNVDGTNKKIIAEMEFPLYNFEAVFNKGKIYVLSRSSYNGKEDEGGVIMTESVISELYEVDINTGKQKQISSFGKKADIGCHAIFHKDNKIYLGMTYQNKNIYESDLKTWDNYMKWLSTETNPYKEALELFDKHCDYYCVNLDDGTVEKMKFNYEMKYDEMEKIKDYYDFKIIYIDDNYCYYATNYGEAYTLYKYDMKNNTCEELDKAYRMTYTYHDEKIYIEKTQYDNDKTLGFDNAEDKSIPPEYRCYNIEREEWEKVQLKENLEGKQLRIEAAGDKYLYGYLCDFIDDTGEEIEEDSEDVVSVFGEICGVEIVK